MRADGVVVDAPGLDGAPGIGEVQKPVFVQACVPELAVEALYQRVLDRLARLNEPQGHAGSLGPQVHRLAGELRAVVGDDRFRPGAIQQDLIQESADAFPGDRGIDDLPDAFPAVVVHDVQHAESAPRGQLIGDEVHRPALVNPSSIGIRTRSRANRRLRRFRLTWSFSSR